MEKKHPRVHVHLRSAGGAMRGVSAVQLPSLHHFRILNSIILAGKMDFVFQKNKIGNTKSANKLEILWTKTHCLTPLRFYYRIPAPLSPSRLVRPPSLIPYVFVPDSFPQYAQKVT
ncbi:unnamed protein product, partial [Nesidiocoris tenuis]